MGYLREGKGGKGGKRGENRDSNLKKADICGVLGKFWDFAAKRLEDR